MASSTINEKANGSRLSRLLVDKGTQALRQVFDAHVNYCSSATLPALLNANKPKLKTLRYKVINSSQWNLLYPASGPPDSKNFDVTLLTILLRQICGLASPAAGWSTMPPDSDTSIEAKVLRIKMFRNEVYAHATTTEVDNRSFDKLWEKISKALIALGIPSSEIDELKEEPLSPEEDGYIFQLEEWKKEEDKLKEIALDTNATVKEILRTVKPSEIKNVSDIDQLAKCDFRGNIRKLSDSFYEGTRTWLFQRFDSWFTDSDLQVMILTAGPGIGKSVFAAKVCDIYQKSGKLAACHFCKFNNSDYRNPHTLLQSLASHMCDNVEGFKDKLAEQLRRSHCKETLSDAFRVLLHDPLYALEERDPMLIVIDAMDESEMEGKSELLELISEEFGDLPKWIKILITSRPELPVQEKLSNLNPLEIRSDNEHNEDDLFRYFNSCLSNTGANDDVVLSLVSQCQGSFLYAYHVQRQLREIKDLTKEKLENIAPKGIAGFYEKQFKRLKNELAPLKLEFKRLANVLVASKGPLPLVLLRECLGLSKEADFELRKAVDDIMSSFLPVYDDCLTVYHKSLIDWLMLDGYNEHLFTADAKDGARLLWCASERLFNEITCSVEELSDLKLTPALRYALQHGLFHLVDVEDWEKFHWFVDLKLNYIKSVVFCGDSNHFDQEVYTDTITENSVLQIICKYLRYTELKKRCSENRKCKSYYLQCAANDCTAIDGEDDNDKKTAISILKRANYIWFEDLNIIKHSSNCLRMSLVPISPDYIAISPNKKLAVLSSLYFDKIVILQLPNLEVVFEYSSEITNSVPCTFSPDSSLLLYGSLNSCLDVKTGKKISFFPNHFGQFVSCSFSVSGNRLVTSDDTKFVKLWDVKQQIQLTIFDAGRSVNDCFFSKCGLFIVAKKNDNLHEYVLIIWNALTWQRIDRRYFNLDLLPFVFSSLSIQFFKASTQSEQNSEIVSLLDTSNSVIFELPYGIPICLLSGFTKCLTTRSGNRYFLLAYIDGKKSFIFLDPFERYVVAERRVQWLTSVSSLFIVMAHGSIIVFDTAGFLVSFKIPNSPPFRSVVLSPFIPPPSRFFSQFPSRPLRPELVSSLFSPFLSVALSPFSDVTVICCSFSQDALFLITCDDKRIVRIWSVESCTVTQTWMFESPVMACWWSKTFLWFVFYTNIAKIPVNAKNGVRFSEIKRMYFNTRDLNVQSLSFSEGVLMLKYSDLNVIGVFKIIDDNITVLPIILPTTYVFDSASVAPRACNILLASVSKYQVYLLKETPLNSLELCLLIDRNVSLSIEDIKGIELLQRLQVYCGLLCSECHITSDGLVGVIVIFSQHPFYTRFLKCIVISLTTGDILRIFSIFEECFTSFKPTFYVGSSFLIFQSENAVHIFKLQDGEIVALWSKERQSTFDSRSVFGFSSRHNLVAIPQSDGYFNFLKLHGLE